VIGRPHFGQCGTPIEANKASVSHRPLVKGQVIALLLITIALVAPYAVAEVKHAAVAKSKKELRYLFNGVDGDYIEEGLSPNAVISYRVARS